MSVPSNKVINGSWGKMIYNGVEIAEVMSVEAKITASRQAINMVQNLDELSKVTGLKGEGKYKIHKVYGGEYKAVVEAWNQGKDPHFSVVFQLTDPDAYGYETVIINDCWHNEILAAQFEANKNLEREYPFGFAPSTLKMEDVINRQ